MPFTFSLVGASEFPLHDETGSILKYERFQRRGPDRIFFCFLTHSLSDDPSSEAYVLLAKKKQYKLRGEAVYLWTIESLCWICGI